MSAPVLVAGCAFSIGAGGLFGSMPWLRPSAGMCPRRGTFFSCVAKKRRQKKATPLSASLRFASGNLRCSRPAGSRSNSLRCASLRQSRALIRWPLRSSAHTEGMGRRTAEQPTSIRAIASLGPILRAQVPRVGHSADWVERSDDPCGCLDVRLSTPCWLRLRRGGCGVSTRVGARVLRDLTRRGCPSGAAQQQSEFHGAPRNRPDAGLPRSEAQGSQTGGRLLLPSFLGDARKEGAPPGAYPGTRPWHRHTAQSASNPQLRQTQPQRLKVTPFAINSVAASAYPISARTQKHLKPQRPTP